jgi:hypothetical protein
VSRRTIAIALAVVAALGLGAVLGATLWGKAEESDRVTAGPAGGPADGAPAAPAKAQPTVDTLPPPPAIAGDGLEGAALELARAINAASALEYHAVYRADPPPTRPGEAPTTITVELWRQLPRARRDTAVVGAKELRTQEYRLFDRFVGCIDASAGSEFVCLEQKGKVDPSDVVLGVVKPSDGPVVASAETVLGVPARCYSVLHAGRPSKRVCFDAVGIPLVIDGGEGQLDRVSLDRTVSNAVFVPPPTRPAQR